MKRRLISIFLTLVMLFGISPINVLAAESDVNTSVGTVRVIVENNTASPAPGGGYGSWESGATQWSGTLVDKEVALQADSDMMTCIADALEGHSVSGIESGYISSIDGLKDGWMGTLNDWFTNDSFENFTYANGKLRSGDVIRLSYTVLYGSDVGSFSDQSNKKLSSLEVTGGTLNPAFSSGVSEYEVVIGDVENANIAITPTAVNKNFLVCSFKQDMSSEQAKALSQESWYNNSALIGRGQYVNVKPGDVITVVSGAPNWPSMSNGEYGCYAENVDPCVYKLKVVKTATDMNASFNAFFTALNGVATVTNDTENIVSENSTYPMQVDNQENALVSGNAGKSKSYSGITLSFNKTAKLSFDYKASSESRYDFFKISKIVEGTETALNDSYTLKADFSGDMSEYQNYNIEVQAGESIRLAYYKDVSGDKNSDCVWLKNFAVTLPNKVTFHANDGTDTTSQQGIFGTAELNANTFTREGYRFDGWATSQNGAVQYNDGAEITLSGSDVDLYAVWTKVWKVTFPNMPEGTKITVKQGENTIPVSATANTWLLQDGNYTYSADLFGYESKTNVSFAVNGADLAVSDELTLAGKTTVTFNVTGQAEGTAVKITVLNGENTEMTATTENANVYLLPAGEYKYTVEATGYKKVKNQTLTVGSEEKNVNVELEVSEAWDGTVTTPKKSNGVYQIGNGAELAGFAKIVNDGETDAKGILTGDIVINEEGELTQQWVPIANTTTAADAFKGSFNGAGYTIYGLYMEGTDVAAGLFGYIGKGGELNDLTLANASITSKKGGYSSSYTGLAVGLNEGTVSGVKLEDSKVSGSYYTGGIAGSNKGTVIGCGNESCTVEHNEKINSSSVSAGGVVGENGGTVTLCYNKASVTASHDKNAYGYYGGIAGKNNSSAVIESCYNQGNLGTVGNYMGGIAGYLLGGTAENCYSTGNVPTGNSYKKALFGNSYGTAKNCYYLTGCGPTDSKGTVKTAEEFKTLAGSLGGAFANTDKYPVLKWENPNATYSVTLTVKPSNAVVTLTNGKQTFSGQKTVNTENNKAVYVYEGLAKGQYSWTADCNTETADDYVSQNGILSLSVKDVSVTAELVQKEYDITFNLTPVNGQLVLTKGEGETAETVTPKTAMDENGKAVYSLPMGTYNYKATAFGYNDKEGSVTVVKSEGLAEQNISLTQKEGYMLSFTDVPEGAVIVVKHATGGIQQQIESNEGTVTYRLVPATYDYSVKKAGFKTLQGTVTMENAPKNIAVSMEALTAWDGTVGTAFAGGNGTENAPYEIESGEELAYLSKLVAEGNESIGSGTYYVLTADIDMNNIVFASIGADSSHTFGGNFDGNGHVISNLKINRESSYSGLFGRANADIHDVTLKQATVTSTAGNTGALVGALYSPGKVTDCVVKNSSVSGASNFTGGMVGYSGTDVSGCAVTDTTVSGYKYVGGVFGQIGKNVAKCYAVGINVTASDSYAGGLIGGGCASKITDCFVRGTVSTQGSYAGGIIADGSNSYSKATIKKTYAVANVSAKTGNYGALAAGEYITVTNASSFYCTESTLSGGTEVEVGTGKTLAELKDSAVLSGLGSEFAIYAEGNLVINAGLPYLKSAPAMEKVTLQTLATPSVSWNGKIANWTAVENATGYSVTLVKDSETEPVFSGKITELTKDFTTVIDLNGSGTYTVSVTALGDGEHYSDSQAAVKATEISISNANVTFNVTRSDEQEFAENNKPVIKLTMADGTTTVNLENGVAKSLPLGNYTYTVSAKTFTTQSDSFELTASGATFNIALDYNSVWDGETTLEPQLVNGVYQISNGYELAWFRDKVNTELASGNQSSILNAVLTDNINLGNHDWESIGKLTGTGEKKGYAGTFDGNGKTVSGLKPVGNEVTAYSKTEIQGAGLFGYVYKNGVVKNVTVEGSMAAVKYSGGIVACLAGGKVENCVNNMNITLSEATTDGYSIGGIVGYMTNYTDKTSEVIGCCNNGSVNIATYGRYVGGVVGNGSYGTTIKNCENTGTVNGKEYLGGVVGNSSLPVIACVNSGAVTGSGDAVGGIVGFSNKETKNCYNNATVKGVGNSKGVGGIVGQLHSEYGGMITGCLNSGKVTATATDGLSGAVTGAKGGTSAVIKGSYFLMGTCTKAIGSNAADNDETTPVTETELHGKRLIGLLGGAFASVEGNNNPVLKWQNENAESVATFVVPEGAVVTVTGKQAVTGEPGVYILDDGSYNYSVSKNGYITENGTLTVEGESQSVVVELSEVVYDVTFNINTSGAVITVKNQSGTVMEPKTEGGSVYSLPNGNYTYVVSKFGFTSVSGSFTVEDAAVEIPQITLSGAATYTVTFTFEDESKTAVTPASVVVKAKDGTVVEADNANSFVYSLPEGTYGYTVDDSRYYKVEDSFTVSGAAKTIPVSLETNRTWDGTTQTAVTANPQGIYEISNAAELAWFAAQVNAGNTGYNAKLTANIYVNYNNSTNEWTPIGNYSNQYVGTFDGNGKAVYGLDTALFGYNGAGSLVKNLTAYGSNSGESNVGGICNASYGSFENCINHMSVTASVQRVGGIVGLLYDTGSIKNCGNFGEIKSTYVGNEYSSYGVTHIGGIAGKSSGNISGSFNAGMVSCTTSYGGAGGIAGELQSAKITDCYNVGEITGPSRTGGIVGIANSTLNTGIENCYNAGKITTISNSANPFCGAVAGSIANSNGAQVGSVQNCYYLKDSYKYVKGSTVLTCGVGYCGSNVADMTVVKSESEMKLDSFVIALSPDSLSFNKDSDNINNGYPVLKWQGGSVAEITQDEKDVAADKAALKVEPTVVTSAGKLKLSTEGAKGSVITWASSNTNVIATDGTVTLPTANDTNVTLTATISKGNAKDTKVFEIIVKTQASADTAVLNTINEKLGTSFRVAYKTGNVNVADTVKEQVNKVIEVNSITGLTANDITVTVKSAGNVTYGSGTLLDSNGKVTYYYANPSSAINGDAVVSNVKFELSTASGATVETEQSIVLIPWDQAKVEAEMQKAADVLTFDTIKGTNISADQVSADLTLPQFMENYGWATISWESSDESVIWLSGGDVLADFVGNVEPAEDDQDIDLDATFTFNKNNTEKDGYITVNKTISVTVPGASNNYMNEINGALEKFTLGSLKYSAGANKNQVINPNAVTDNISLLIPRELGIDGGRNGYQVEYSAYVNGTETCPVTVNSYRANVIRPISEEPVEVTLKLTITKKNEGVLDTRYTGNKELKIKVSPLVPAEIDAELALLDTVKANFFKGIQNENLVQDAVIGDLHAFKEAYLNENGKLVWVYNIKDTADIGIVPTDLPKEGYDETYNLYHSSAPTVIKHENLLVTCPQDENANVTITANLKSYRFGDYYNTYKDDPVYGPKFKRLAGEQVSVTVTVLSKAEQDKAAAVVKQIDNLFPITAESGNSVVAAEQSYNALSNGGKKLVSNADKLSEAQVDYVEALINAIGTVTLESQAAINAAEEAYNNLTDEQKTQVTNYQTLSDAKARYEELSNKPLPPGGGGTVKPIEPVEPVEPVKPEIDMPFTDVMEGNWFYESVWFAYANGLMKGTDTDLFSPNDNTTRGMIVTILARLEGVDTATGKIWYEAGREWAMNNGISDGTYMDGEITREQLAAMLYRYATVKGYDVSKTADLSGFTDAGDISQWANQAMQWAVEIGLINGRTETSLVPQGEATRAEVATILMRFIQNVVE